MILVKTKFSSKHEAGSNFCSTIKAFLLGERRKCWLKHEILAKKKIKFGQKRNYGQKIKYWFEIKIWSKRQ